MRLSVLIPAYDEERTIGTVLRRLTSLERAGLGAELELVVCDDGSRDQTAREVARAQGSGLAVRLISHDRNCGKGRAIRSALAVASGDYVLIQDADLEYDVSDYPALLAAVREGARVVYGSRFLARSVPERMGWIQRVGNRLLTAIANVFFGLRLTDEATCLKLFETDLLRALELTCERFDFCPEVTAKLALLRVPIVEVPVRYRARGASEGKKVRWTDGVRAIAVLARLRLRASCVGAGALRDGSHGICP